MLRKPQKPPEGAKLKETADMIAWKKDFQKMKTEDHLSKLKELGLDDEDLDEFKALEKGEISLEEEMNAGPTQEEAPKKKAKK